ncbi:MAG: GGDEF domain-containing phosphodiesterase, partial [Nautiliaceae bacterium]
TVILKNLKNRQVIEKIAKKIINEIKKPIYIDNLTVFVGSSIGVYTYSPDDSTQDILSKADIAMYEAKNKGKGIYTFFDEPMQEKLTKLTILKNNIKKALQNKSFINHFQPIISSVSKKIIGVETLLRLKHGNSIIPPTEFIPILEEDINLIKEVTFWQIKSVIKKLKNKNIFYSINLSAKLLNDEDILNYLSNLKTKIKFDPSKLHFEVTETALSENLYKASDILRKIKKMEFNLSLDDFGTGYSSLAYLRDLPFETLKIDKKFIDNIVKSKKDQKLLKSIISMAEIMDMKIILEGIETKEQLKIVPSKKIIKYQGYYFYKPMPYIKLASLI